MIHVSAWVLFVAESLAQFDSPQFHVYVVNGSLITDPSSPIVARVDNDTSEIRNFEVLCDDGNYCLEGQRFPCPAGTYGDQRVRVCVRVCVYVCVCVAFRVSV